MKSIKPKQSEQETSLARVAKYGWLKTLGRCSRYMVVRGVVVFLTVLVGIYAAIWVSNIGGYADEIRRTDIEWSVRFAINSSGALLKDLTASEKDAVYQEAINKALETSDLDKPFALRSLRYFRQALTLTLGETSVLWASGNDTVLDILLAKLPMTVLLFGVANILIFFGGLFIAVSLSRRYGRLVDRVVTLLIPALAAPPWLHGIILIVVFASLLKVLPFGGIVDVPIPQTSIGYMLSVLKHMILPVSALVLGTLPVAVYSNRALFMIHSAEDYVELARAKGVGMHRLQRRYILRPLLPPIITNFALISVVAWQGVVITERIFNWPGLGSLLIEAIQQHEVSIVIGAVTLFAYLLGVSILFLDVLYMLVDPRVSLEKRRT